MGSLNVAWATFWERIRGTSSNELGKQMGSEVWRSHADKAARLRARTFVSNPTLVRLQGCGWRSTLSTSLGSVCQAQKENCETISYIHQRSQNSKNSGRRHQHNPTSISAISHTGKLFKRQKICNHTVWQNISDGQCVCAQWLQSLAIHGGVRQGCVLSPRLFCAALEMAMVNWRDEREHLALSLPDGGRLRCADDILIFGTDFGFDCDPVCREAAHLGHRKWNAKAFYVQTTHENGKYNIIAGKTKWSWSSIETRDRCFRQCQSSCLNDASGKKIVEEFAIEKIDVQASHLLGSNARFYPTIFGTDYHLLEHSWTNLLKTSHIGVIIESIKKKCRHQFFTGNEATSGSDACWWRHRFIRLQAAAIAVSAKGKKSESIATIFHERKFFRRQKCFIIPSQGRAKVRHYTQGTCEGTTLKCEKCCVAWSLRLWELIGRRLGMWFSLVARTQKQCGTSVCIFAMVSGGHNWGLEICCIHQNVASAKMVVWTGRHPTTDDVAETSTETWHRFESEFVAFITGR